MNVRFLFSVAAAVQFIGLATQTATPGLTTTATTAGALSRPPIDLGWDFTVNSDIVVSGLGVFASA